MAKNAIQDENQQFSPVFAQGTLGTADVKGTSGVVSGAADPLTGAQYVYNLAPAGSLEVGSITVGNINQIGTVTEITNGTIRVTDGTVKVVTPGTITSGTVSINAGTIGAGTLNTLGTVSNILAGTIQNSGTVTGVGVVSNITNGSIVVTAGTVTTTMGDLSGGTIDEITNGSIRVTAGTVSQAGAWNVTGTVANGSIAVTAGTIGAGTLNTLGTVSNILAGTIQNSGTVTGVGVVSNITNGSIVVTAGTVSLATQLAGEDLTNNLLKVAGNIAHDSADVGNPIKIGGKAGTTTPGTVAAGDRVDAYFDNTGHQMIKVASGTVTTTMGDLSGGTIDLLSAGTIDMLKAGTLTQLGTVQNIGVIHNAGTIAGGTIAGAGVVTTVSNLTNGSIAVTAGTITNLLKAEDALHSTGDSGVMMLGVRNDTGANLSNTDGDYTPIGVDITGAVRTTIFGQDDPTAYVPVFTNDTSVNDGVNGLSVYVTGGNKQHDAADGGGPLKIGGKAGTATPGTVAHNDRVNAYFDNVGRIAVFDGNLAWGTVNNVGTVPGVGVVTTVSNLTNGTVRVTAGTVNSGTINAGTINSGTINAGTVTTQPYPASQVQPAYAVGTAAAGTLVAAVGAGTGIYVNSIAITAMSGTLDMCLSYALGSTTNQVVQRGLYAPGQGVALSFDNPSFYGTANAALTYQILSGAGTASWAVTYNTKGTP